MIIQHKNNQAEQKPVIVNAVCVDVINLGIVETPWGHKPQLKFAFEADQRSLFGEARILVRTFHNCTYKKSALRQFVKSWCGRDLAEEANHGTINLHSLIGKQARLKTLLTPTQRGGWFDKIVGIRKPGKVQVQPSGNYERQD
jgi:hypothetical protein